jgi:hypothetical protein
MNYQIGDFVKYSKQLAQMTNGAKKRGVVFSIEYQVRPNGPFYLKVQWIGEKWPSGVLSSNIAKARGRQ